MGKNNQKRELYVVVVVAAFVFFEILASPICTQTTKYFLKSFSTTLYLFSAKCEKDK